MIQLISIIFSTIPFYYECWKSGGGVGGREGVGRETAPNQGDSPSFPDTCHIWSEKNFKIYCFIRDWATRLAIDLTDRSQT